MNYEQLRKEIRKRDYNDIVGLKATITEKEYDYFLGALPPIYIETHKRKTITNGFLLSETLTHDPKAINYYFYIEDNKFYCEIVYRSELINDKMLIEGGFI